MKTLINSKGQSIGEVKLGVYRKVVDKKRHLMKKHNAWGLDETVISDPDIKEVKILDRSEMIVYTAPIQKIKYYALVEDYDGLQFFYPLNKFESHAFKKSHKN